ncbi:MAG: MBL fold metallo-hydrolase [Promicromonosporaceae bacterium]|nr:MBL fold metallo-hydrolase [Promicromonosporaceae bacterium]
MQLTKHVHACVSLAKEGRRIVIDPGTLTPDAAEAVAAADVVLITHEHFDHVDEALVAAALAARHALRVYGPASVVERWAEHGDQVRAVAAGDAFTVAGFDVVVAGDLHAEIHRDVPRPANVGYLVDGRVYHPGDSYGVPPFAVETLLLPTSGPWTHLAQAVELVRAVAPQRLVQIHEVMLSDIGQQSMARFLSPEMLSPVPLTIVPPGDTITV